MQEGINCNFDWSNEYLIIIYYIGKQKYWKELIMSRLMRLLFFHIDLGERE